MKIFCIGRNYAAHAAELQNEIPSEPVVFMKPISALLKGNQPLYYPSFTQNLHYEGEVVLRIGKNGKKIQEKFATGYIDAITLGFDFTARDIQDKLKAKGLPWEIAKGFDGSAAIGNFIPISDIVNFPNIAFTVLKNGEIVQNGDTRLLLFSFAKIISYISQYFTLHTGDLIFTGTPEGVGPVQIGDILTARIGENQLISCAIK